MDLLVPGNNFSNIYVKLYFFIFSQIAHKGNYIVQDVVCCHVDVQ